MRALFLAVLLSSSVWAQESDFTIVNCKPIKGNYLWAAETEVSNFQYLEFVKSIEKEKGEQAKNAMLPDTTVWVSKFFAFDAYQKHYFRHPAYRNYPVVGITHAQAIKYCEWLTGSLNDKFGKNPKHPVRSVIVKLPTKKEWQLAARAGNEYALFPWEGSTMKRTDKKWEGDYRANYMRNLSHYRGQQEKQDDNADITAPIRSYWPNDFGLYNMSGNVAELLSEPGQSIGGSWRSRAPFLKIDNEEEFPGVLESRSEIGFRYFIEVVEFKTSPPEKTNQLTAKLIEKMISSLDESDSVFAGKHEVTNELYNQFLVETGKTEFASNEKLWNEVIEYPAIHVNNYTDYLKFSNYPVVNVSREGAEAFCEWLTQKYNGLATKKHRQMVFRLPTESEWETAALGGMKLAKFPWGGPYITNRKGHYLSNYNPLHEYWRMDKGDQLLVEELSKNEIQEAGKLDGHLYTASVESYFPNNIGAYCMSGNVAEMVSDKSITKGGSWGSFKYKTSIKTSEEYIGPSPYVGFRFFGEVMVDDQR